VTDTTAIGRAPRLRSQTAFWVFWMMVSGCVLFTVVEQVAYFSSYPEAWFLSIALLAATAIPAGVIIYRFDQFETEPGSLIAVAVIWGGVVAVTFSGIVNEMTYGFLQNVAPAATVEAWAAALVAPVNEELYKGAGLVLLYLMARREFDGVMDGLVYGAMIGLGFQVMENVQYFMLAAARSGGAVEAVTNMFFLRVVLSGLYSHMLFTAFFGFGFAYFITQRKKRLAGRVAVLILGAVLAWASHFVWNSPWLESMMTRGTGQFVGALVIKGLPFLILLSLLGVFANRRERQVFACLMRSEVGGDAVSQGEFYVLQRGRRRRQALRRLRQSKGVEGARVFRRLMREQINLALLRSRVPAGDHPALQAQRDLIKQLKARLAAIGS
jgi:RsiW-degrading membrane proteinase PrsW (M82 family)